ncbi:hypothetical protein [Clostridium sp.]|uniref:DUF6115 domain-containing protein n=1 Tax=Clostridium sp. TaxID=1506 RepID=UPI002FC5DB05
MYIMLFTIGISLVILNALAIKREKRSFKNTFQIAESDITETDIKIGELRREFAETITELQSEIIYLKELVESLQSNDSKLHNSNNYEVKVVGKTEVNTELKDSIMDDLREFYYNNAENLETSYNKNILLENLSVEKQENTETSSSSDKYEDENKEIKESHRVEKNMEPSSNNLKIEDVRNLFDKGLNVDEIASQLNIGKGEVLLIKELYLR